MKKAITVRDLYDLSRGHADLYKSWMREKGYLSEVFTDEDACMSLGQMFEFLSDNLKEGANILEMPSIKEGRITQHELCDFLWEAIKRVLEIKSSKK